MTNDFEIEIIDASDVEARVVTRAVGHGLVDGLELAGKVIGPFCDGAKTLPATIPLRQLSDPLTAEALIPDPCFCENNLQYYYRFELALMKNNVALVEEQRLVGLRRLGASYVAGEEELGD